MAILVHLCRGCGHDENCHLAPSPDRKDWYTSCRCCKAMPGTTRDVDPEPTVQQTKTYPGFELEPLHEPVTTRNAGVSGRQELCGCGTCRDRYAELTAQ